MIKTLKIRLEPNNKQNTLMFKSAGTARWAYNWALGKEEENYKQGNKFISDCDLRKELTQLKKQDNYQWLSDVSNDIAKQAVKDACTAYMNFFKHLAEHPKFKSKKKSMPSFYSDTSKIKFTENKVFLSKIGWITLSEKSRIPLDSKYMNPRIKYDGLHWYLTVAIEVEEFRPVLTGESIGIDLGLKDLAIVSNFEKPFKNVNKSNKVKKLEKKLKRLQRQVSRKYEANKQGCKYVKTKNILKTEKQIRKVHKQLSNIRTDYIQKVSTEIVRTKPSQIVMEDLNVKGMMKNRKKSKAIQQQKWREFRELMRYKSFRDGIEFVEANRWFPSSKTCSNCGYIKPKLLESERTYVCECCGFVIDRDKNAALNLANYKVT